MINQTQIMMQEIKLYINQNYENLIFVIAMMFTYISDDISPQHIIRTAQHITGTRTDDTEDLDLIMPMYNLLESSSNYSDTAVSLWFYSKDEANYFQTNIAKNNAFNSFEYKAKI